MKLFVYRKNYLGFRDWIHDLNKIRHIINTYEGTNDRDYREKLFPEYSEALVCYKDYLFLKKMLTHDEQEYIDMVRRRKTPSYNLRTQNLYSKWEKYIYGSGHVNLLEIHNSEVGDAIKAARELRCFTRQQVAEILEISPNTLKMYELGQRTLPFDIYYKMIQFLEIGFKKDE